MPFQLGLGQPDAGSIRPAASIFETSVCILVSCAKTSSKLRMAGVQRLSCPCCAQLCFPAVLRIQDAAVRYASVSEPRCRELRLGPSPQVACRLLQPRSRGLEVQQVSPHCALYLLGPQHGNTGDCVVAVVQRQRRRSLLRAALTDTPPWTLDQIAGLAFGVRFSASHEPGVSYLRFALFTSQTCALHRRLCWQVYMWHIRQMWWSHGSSAASWASARLAAA